MPALAAFPSVPGIENFYRVDDQVYRGAQPTDEGFKYLSKIGVKVVLDLRQHKEASEERLVTAAGMRYVSVPMTGLTPPTQAETNAVLALLEDQAAGPVFVHCKRGADRTGAVIAAYRIDQEKWDNARALREAMADGMSPRQVPRKKFIRTFQSRNTAPAAGAEDASVTHI
jgi:protein tyrosine/serine phosphatase